MDVVVDLLDLRKCVSRTSTSGFGYPEETHKEALQVLVVLLWSGKESLDRRSIASASDSDKAGIVHGVAVSTQILVLGALALYLPLQRWWTVPAVL
jgi:hypothetical protein